VPVRLIRADARQIPLRDASIDVVTIGFGSGTSPMCPRPSRTCTA